MSESDHPPVDPLTLLGSIEGPADLDVVALVDNDGPPVDPLREAAQLVAAQFGGYPEGYWSRADQAALDALRAALVSPAVSLEAFAVESPLDVETIRAAFLVLNHAGFEVVRKRALASPAAPRPEGPWCRAHNDYTYLCADRHVAAAPRPEDAALYWAKYEGVVAGMAAAPRPAGLDVEQVARALGPIIFVHTPFRPDAVEGDFAGQVNIAMHNATLASEREHCREKARVFLARLSDTGGTQNG